MRLGLDLDGCIYNFVDDFLGVLRSESYFEAKDVDDPGNGWDPPVYGFFRELKMKPEEFGRWLNFGISKRQLYRNGQPYPEAIEVIRGLRLKGHTIHIITHRTFEGRGVHNTMDWLQKSGLEFDSITFSEDKTLVGVDLLLDDYEKNWKAAQDQGIECVLMSHSYNEHVTAATRVDGWVQFGQIVELVYDLF